FFYFFFFFFFFFFQAEDGIRDLYVTGVQTCALPIYAIGAVARTLISMAFENKPFYRVTGYSGVTWMPIAALGVLSWGAAMVLWRSEERRVGKECRSRWWWYYLKKK